MSETFDDLFVEKEEINEEILKNLLKDRIKMTSEGDVLPQKTFKPKISLLLYLLANKVFVIKKIKKDESEGPKEIHSKTGIPEGTIKVYVRELEKEGVLLNKKGKYRIPNHALIKIKKLITENDKTN